MPHTYVNFAFYHKQTSFSTTFPPYKKNNSPAALNIKTKVHHIAVLHYIILAFQSHQALLPCSLLTA
ncbi:hypothetical protein SAMN05660860_01432 [Geoalkalibacter ferrihydriticus]|uniref:Uncharacterized protein n=1 Tax=Geoalkalibacter ferrihydriticus TaxID=392333 RepID=A0A1G9NZ46_9BACT|nr:hypothetical protein SAMN05660860_01432 [Geoalkalibacter ferrihydriticus]